MKKSVRIMTLPLKQAFVFVSDEYKGLVNYLIKHRLYYVQLVRKDDPAMNGDLERVCSEDQVFLVDLASSGVSDSEIVVEEITLLLKSYKYGVKEIFDEGLMWWFKKPTMQAGLGNAQ